MEVNSFSLETARCSLEAVGLMNLSIGDEVGANLLLAESMLLFVRSSESVVGAPFFRYPSLSLGEAKARADAGP